MDHRMTKTRTIELSEPIKDHRGNLITEITLREPTFADLAEAGLIWILKLADADATTLDALCPEDADALREAAISLLLDAAPPTLTVAAHPAHEGARRWQ
jgi:hypothetical protein